MSAATQKSMQSKWGAWIWVKWKAGTPEDTWNEWKKWPEIKEAWSTSGYWDCWLWVDIENADEIEQFVWKAIRGNKWVEETETSFAKKWW